MVHLSHLLLGQGCHETLADIGASSHIANSLDGMTDLKKKDGGIQVGNGDMAKVQYIGTYHGYITNNKEEK